MIRHVVVFKLQATDPDVKQQNFLEMKSRLEKLVACDPGIVSISVSKGMDLVDFHWDVILTGDYETQQALDNYQVHPDHKDFIAWVANVISDKVVIDFEV